MTDVQTIEVDAQPSVEDVLAARNRAASTAASTAIAGTIVPEGMVALYDPEYESLTYGSGDGTEGGNIQFGPKGGFEPNVWVGPEDHPLLAALLDSHPAIFQIGAPKEVYVCPDCSPVGSAKFNSLMAYRGHQGARHPRVVKS